MCFFFYQFSIVFHGSVMGYITFTACHQSPRIFVESPCTIQIHALVLPSVDKQMLRPVPHELDPLKARWDLNVPQTVGSKNWLALSREWGNQPLHWYIGDETFLIPYYSKGQLENHQCMFRETKMHWRFWVEKIPVLEVLLHPVLLFARKTGQSFNIAKAWVRYGPLITGGYRIMKRKCYGTFDEHFGNKCWQNIGSQAYIWPNYNISPT